MQQADLEGKGPHAATSCGLAAIGRRPARPTRSARRVAASRRPDLARRRRGAGSSAGGIGEQRAQPLGEHLRRRRSASGISQPAPAPAEADGIGGLVIVGGMGIGHQDRRPAGGGELGHGRGAGARDHEMGAAEPLGHVGEEGRRARPAWPSGGIGAAHLLQILGPALLGDATGAGAGPAAAAASAAGISRAKIRAPWLPPRTSRSKRAVDRRDRAAAPRAAIAGRTGLPVKRARRPCPDAAVSAKEVAIARARGASRRLARPSTAFCSCSTVGDAGALGGQHRRHRGIAAEAHRPRPARSRRSRPARLRGSRAQSSAMPWARRMRPPPASPPALMRCTLDRRQAVAEAAAAAVGDQADAIAAARAARRPAPRPGTYGRRCRRRRARRGRRSCQRALAGAPARSAPATCPWRAPAPAARSRHSR